jgi:Large polyvalent protein associated domain 38
MVDLVSQYRDAGFSDAEIASHLQAKREGYKAAGFNDDEINDHLGIPRDPKGVPDALIKRIVDVPKVDMTSGMFLSTDENGRMVAAPGVPSRIDAPQQPRGFAERIGAGVGEEPLGISPQNLEKYNWAKYLQPFAATGDVLLRAFPAAIGGGVGALSALYEKATGDVSGADQAQRDLGILGTTVALLEGSRPVTKVGLGATGEPQATRIGGLPKGEDFQTAGRVLGNGDTTPAMETKLTDIYERKGVPPAEVVHDAQSDVTITQSILSSDKTDMPAVYEMDLLHGYSKDRGFSGFQPLEKVPDDIRYDGGNGVFGKQTYLDPNGKWITGENGPLGIDAAVRVKASFDKLFVLTPDKIGDLEKLIGKDAIKDGADIAEALKAKGYDGIQVKGFDNYTGETGALDPNVSQDQVVSFAPDKNLKVIGKVDLPERPRNATPEEAQAYFDKRKAAIEDILTEGKPTSAGAAAAPGPSYSDAEKQILSKISIGEKSPEARMTLDKLYTNVLDKLYPIGKTVKEIAPDLPAEENPYQLARLLTGHVGKADHFLNQATFDFSTYEANGPSLKSILNPVRGDLNGFRAYAAAARALELEDRGIKSGFDFGEGGAPPLISSGLEAARTVVVEGREKYEKPFRELIDYQNRVSAYLRDSGVLSDAGYKAMVEANKMYVPFTRVMGIDENAQARGGSSLQATNPIKAIKGSARSIIDPIESVVRNTYHMIEMAEKNVVGTKLVDMLKRAEEGLPEAPKAVETGEVAESGRAGAMAEALGEIGVKSPDELSAALAHASEPLREGEIAILRDGKRETYKVDPELARAMKGLDAQTMGMWEKIMAYPASVLRAGAVLTPDFAIRHTIRDYLYATTTYKGEGVFTPMDMAKGFAGVIMKDEDFWNWMKGGGGNIASVGMDRRYLQENLRELTGQTGLVGRSWNVLTDPNATMWQKTAQVGTLPFQAIDKFVLDPLRAMTQMAENASHLGAFKKAMRASERAEPEATDLRSQIIRSAWISRDTAVDAARMGANMRAWNMITAFSNIKLQDTDRVVRAIKDNPIATMTMITGAITIPSILLWAANHDDPRYDEIPHWERDLNWNLMVGDHIFRVSKPWSMGLVFGSLPERLLDGYASQKPDAFKDYFKDLWAATGPDFVPTGAAPIIDHFANRSTFTNRTLIPSAQEKFLPEYQYTPYTTELTKSLGQMLGAFPGLSQLKMDNSGWGGTAKALTSPILMENYIRGWTGTLGIYALQAADKGLRTAGVIPDPPKPASTLADIPVIKAFVVRYPSASAESIQSFYDEYEKNKSYFTTMQAMAKDGNLAAVQHIRDMGGPAMFVQLDGIHKTLTEHNQFVRNIYKNPEIPPEEKRQLIDTAYGNMIQVAKHGNDVLRQQREKAADVISQAASLDTGDISRFLGP